MGGVMVSRRMIQSRLGWLNTVSEPQTEQKTKTAMETEVVREKHDENRVQDKDANIQNQELTEPSDITRSTEKENIEKGKGDENVSGILAYIEVMEIAKEQKEDIGEERDDMIVK